MTDVGKMAKVSGAQHPRDARKIDPEPARATPAAKPKRKADKPYGFSYEMKWWNKGWVTRHYWYRTERARDQAMDAAQKKSRTATWLHFRDFQKCARASGPRGEERK